MDIFKLLLNIVVLNYVRNKEFFKVGFRLGYVIFLVAIVFGINWVRLIVFTAEYGNLASRNHVGHSGGPFRVGFELFSLTEFVVEGYLLATGVLNDSRFFIVTYYNNIRIGISREHC